MRITSTIYEGEEARRVKGQGKSEGARVREGGGGSCGWLAGLSNCALMGLIVW